MFEEEIRNALKSLFDVSTLLTKIERWAKEFNVPVPPEVDALLSGQKKSPTERGAQCCFKIK